MKIFGAPLLLEETTARYGRESLGEPAVYVRYEKVVENDMRKWGRLHPYTPIPYVRERVHIDAISGIERQHLGPCLPFEQGRGDHRRLVYHRTGRLRDRADQRVVHMLHESGKGIGEKHEAEPLQEI